MPGVSSSVQVLDRRKLSGNLDFFRDIASNRWQSCKYGSGPMESCVSHGDPRSSHTLEQQLGDGQLDGLAALTPCQVMIRHPITGRRFIDVIHVFCLHMPHARMKPRMHPAHAWCARFWPSYVKASSAVMHHALCFHCCLSLTFRMGGGSASYLTACCNGAASCARSCCMLKG